MNVIVIGGGIGGYTCAIRLAQNGASVTLVEKDKMGGTCLNRGCIPTKAILHSAKMYEEAKNFSKLGIEIEDAFIDLEKVIERKDGIVTKLRGGVEYLMKKNRIRVVYGSARFTGDKEVTVATAQGEEILNADCFVIATGSSPFEIPVAHSDGETILTSDHILSMKEQPDSLIVIGGGVIGCEIAQAFSMMDTEVTIVEMLPRILANMDEGLSALLNKTLTSEGVRIETGTKLTECEITDEGVRITVEKDGSTIELEAEKMLVATGRRANTAGLGLDICGVNVDKRGCVPTDEHMRTNIEHIYAIGDVTGNIQLAHVAGHQGMVAADNITGNTREMDYRCVPLCIYTSPELASLGETEKSAEIPVKTGMFPMSANGRSMIEGCTDGFAKVVVSEEDNTILGIQLAGANVTEMISGLAGTIGFEANTDDVSEWIFAHPSVSEAIYESVLDVDSKSIHK